MSRIQAIRSQTILVAAILLGGGVSEVKAIDLKPALGPVVVELIKRCTPDGIGVEHHGIGVTARRQNEECEHFDVWEDGAFQIQGYCKYVARIRNPLGGGSVTVFDSHLRMKIKGNVLRGEVNVILDAGQLHGLINLSAITNLLKNEIGRLQPRIRDEHRRGSTQRSVFRYTTGQFQRVDSQRWVERRDRGPDSWFVQTASNGEYVELFDSQRQMYVRLLQNVGIFRGRDSSDWHRWPGAEGRWVR